RIVYTTCTYAPEENEINAERFARRFDDLKPVEFDFPAEWGVESVGMGYALLPHRCVGEGFFMAAWDKADAHAPVLRARAVKEARPRMQTPGKWFDFGGRLRVATDEAARIASLIPGVRAVGLAAGQEHRREFVPAHDLAYLPGPGLELERNDALRFLKGDVPLPPPEHPGQILRLTFMGMGLGWVKAVGRQRWNSLLPPALRIRGPIDEE
ncbi:MAG: hypothetical protein NZ534_12775, partial [Bacteroidia bacterium]|nr:hypothetical protein [Bacteroidia bacterium]